MAVSIYCPHCRKHTALSTAQAHFNHMGRDGQTGAIWFSQFDKCNWWIGICNACHQPSLVKEAGQIIYPTPLPSPTDPNIPEELASDLNEAKKCFSIESYRASAVMSRRCIQTACILKGAANGNLIAQIEELTSKGVITHEIEEWATVVRWVGNDAAHPNKDTVEKEDAKDALDLAEQFLHVIFVAPAIAKIRRAAMGK